MYFLNIFENDYNFTLVKISIKIHFTKNLKTNIFINIDVFIFHQFLLNYFNSQSIIIVNYQNIKIFVKSIINFFAQIKRTIKTRSVITFLPKSIINIFIIYINTFSENRDFLFEPEFSINYFFNFDDKIFVYIVDIIIIFVQTRNFTKILITFFKYIKFDTIIEYSINKYYQISYKSTKLTTCE